MGESQEETSEHDCQKCGKAIQQVPYKYEGKYFHARCLTCNNCSKKLAGRPFLTVERQIFCGDQCQECYYEEQHSHTNASTASSATDPEREGNQSLLEALTSAEQTSTPSPRDHPDVTLSRITDYPGHSLSQSSPASIRRSSLSVSESSLTSSLTSEGGSPGQPRKRILKKPHGPRKNQSNRVHWNIPEEEGGGDRVSLLSFESTSTTSGVSSAYQLARESVSESRRNWREFEQLPPPGSTGLTPTKPTLREKSVDHASSLSLDHTHHDKQLVSPLQLLWTQPHRPGAGTSSDTGIRPGSSLTYLGATTPYHTSTPLRRHSESAMATTPKTAEFCVNRVDGVSTPSSVAPPPILRLDHSNLSELEASTVEERARSNLFEFPSVTKPGLRGSPMIPTPPSYSGYIPPEGHTHLCGGSDADDYDHLSPNSVAPPPHTLAVANRNVRADFFPRPSKSRTRRSSPHLGSPSPPPQPPGNPPPPGKSGAVPHRYGDNDIDEALNDLTDSASSRSGSSAPQSPLPNPSLSGPLTKQNSAPGGHENDGGIPPPIPPKLRRHKSDSPTTRVSNSLPLSSSSSPGVGGGSLGLTEKLPNGVTPEFASGHAHPVEWAELSSDEGQHDDALSSVSTATLVPSEPGDSHPPPTHSAPNSRTTFNQTGNLGGVALMRTHLQSVRVHPENFPPFSSSAPTHQSWVPQWKEIGASLAPHPPSLPYRKAPTLSTYPHEPQLHPIEENLNPERQAVITVSNSGSDSSLRGVSPPEKISQASVIPKNQFDRNFYYEDSLSQPLPLPVRPLSVSTARGHPQVPRLRNPPSGSGTGGHMMNRNHRLYHSHRSGLAPRPRHRGPGNFPQGVRPPPQSVPGNPRGGLKFQYSLDSLEASPEEVSTTTRSYSPPYQSWALSQDDPPLGATFYPLGGPGSGRGLLPRPRIRSTDGAIHRPRHPHQSQGHTHQPRPLQGHTHQAINPLQAHHRNTHVPQLLKKAHSMTAV